jgi:hypothetical protein
MEEQGLLGAFSRVHGHISEIHKRRLGHPSLPNTAQSWTQEITAHLISGGLIVRVGRTLRNALQPPPQQPLVCIRPLPSR